MTMNESTMTTPRPTPMRVLLQPGIHGSGPAHWQSRWLARHDGVRRIEQHDWDRPDCSTWADAIDAALRTEAAPVLLVAHSLGCLALAHWAARQPAPAAGRPRHRLMMVAVPDPLGPNFPAAASGFAPLPGHVSGHALLMVSSEDDSYANPAHTQGRVQAWRATHLALGRHGHLNADSGLGDWPDGWALASRWRDPAFDPAAPPV